MAAFRFQFHPPGERPSWLARYLTQRRSRWIALLLIVLIVAGYIGAALIPLGRMTHWERVTDTLGRLRIGDDLYFVTTSLQKSIPPGNEFTTTVQMRATRARIDEMGTHWVILRDAKGKEQTRDIVALDPPFHVQFADTTEIDAIERTVRAEWVGTEWDPSPTVFWDPSGRSVLATRLSNAPGDQPIEVRPGFMIRWDKYGPHLVLLCIPAIVAILFVILGRKAWLHQLAHHSYFFCEQCGYDLRETMEGRCPECGTIFSPPTVSRMHGLER